MPLEVAQTRVARLELSERLAAGLDRGSVILVADAGFGKTTALEQALDAPGRADRLAAHRPRRCRSGQARRPPGRRDPAGGPRRGRGLRGTVRRRARAARRGRSGARPRGGHRAAAARAAGGGDRRRGTPRRDTRRRDPGRAARRKRRTPSRGPLFPPAPAPQARAAEGNRSPHGAGAGRPGVLTGGVRGMPQAGARPGALGRRGRGIVRGHRGLAPGCRACRRGGTQLRAACGARP